MSSKMQNWTVPLIAVFLGMIAGAILMLAFGYNPLFAYNDLIYTSLFSSVKNIGEVLAQTGPLILIALGFAVSSKAGFFNVGLPGQALAGWFVAAWFALMHPDLPKPLSLLGSHCLGSWWDYWRHPWYLKSLSWNQRSYCHHHDELHRSLCNPRADR